MQYNKLAKLRLGLDLDFEAGFDWLYMSWVYLVLSKKGVCDQVVNRIKRLYADSTTIVVVNNVLGKQFSNIRGSLRQGDVPSMFWFSTGIDPLLIYLEKTLSGIPIFSLPVAGPAPHTSASPTLNPLKQLYKLVAYADDVKPSITTMHEFYVVDNACTILEKASGVKLHRDPSAGKVKFLPLGRWKGTLTQEDLPHQYITLSDHLDFVGVELRDTFIQTRKANGDQLQSRIKNTVGPWKTGKFMPLTLRPYSANTYALSKVWFKCSSINLRVQDINTINSQVKGWLYQDCFEKPSETVLYRDSTDGGLGLFNVKIRSLALLIRSFLETALHPAFRHSLYHEALFRFHVLNDDSVPNPGFPPYYDVDFFNTLKHYHETSPMNIAVMSIKQWYKVLLDDQVLMNPTIGDMAPSLVPVRVEELSPEIDWDITWRMSRMKGLDSELTAFIFKLLHCLLPSQDRVSRITRNQTQNIGLCLLCQTEVEDLPHAFFSCRHSCVAGLSLLGYLQVLCPNTSQEDALHLQLGHDLDEQEQLAAVCLLATGLKYIWSTRVEKKAVILYKMRSEIEAKISVLRRTRYSSAGDKIAEMIR